VRLAPSRDSALAARPTRDVQAHDLYLKGLFAWNQRTGASLAEAVRYLEAAVARDSSFARAWAALAQAYLLVVPYGGGGTIEDTWRKAQAAAGRALALDPQSADAYTARAYGNMVYGWNWPAAEADFERALAVDRNYAVGHHWYGDFLAGRGRLEEAQARMDTAHVLDPLSRQIGNERGWVAYLRHRNDVAEARMREVIALDPNYAQVHLRLAYVLVQQRRFDEALAEMRRALALGAFYPHAAPGLAHAHAGAGRRDSALAVVRDLLARREAGEYIPSVFVAAAYAAVGDTTRAFEWLNRGIDERDIYIPENFFEPFLDPLRGDPRYGRVLERMGLEQTQARAR
jgi:serine/threonine-protein kinase